MTDEKMPRRAVDRYSPSTRKDMLGLMERDPWGDWIEAADYDSLATDHDKLRELARAVVEADNAVEASAFEDEMDAVPLLAKRKFATVALRAHLDATEKEV